MPDSLGRFQKGEHWRSPKPHWQREWLAEQYITRGRSTGDIKEECGCTEAAIIYWMRKHGIDRRSVSEARALKHWGATGVANPMHGKTGVLNPRYVDGSSPERQRLYVRGAGRAFLRAVLGRDEYRCRRCRMGNTGKRTLHVHHVKSWAGHEELRFDMGNAVTLCRTCHRWVHSRLNTLREFIG